MSIYCADACRRASLVVVRMGLKLPKDMSEINVVSMVKPANRLRRIVFHNGERDLHKLTYSLCVVDWLTNIIGHMLRACVL